MKKRIFALALALCMMLSVMPTSFAGNGFLTDDSKAAPQSGILTDDSKTVSQSGALTGASKYYRQDGILYNTGSQSGASYSLPSGTNDYVPALTEDYGVDSFYGSSYRMPNRASAVLLAEDAGTEVLDAGAYGTGASYIKGGESMTDSGESGGSGGDTSDNGLKLNKTVTPNQDDGSYTVTLEAYTTGTVTTITEQRPANIMLLIDQSSKCLTDAMVEQLKQAVIDFVTDLRNKGGAYKLNIKGFASGESGAKITQEWVDIDDFSDAGFNSITYKSAQSQHAGALEDALNAFKSTDNSNGIYTGDNVSNVLILFSANTPCKGQGTFDVEQANSALGYAYQLKNKGITIFSVGVQTDAKAEEALPDYPTNKPADQSNRYGQLVSSNYPNATNMQTPGTRADDRYYLVDEAGSISHIFGTISNQISASNSTLTESAVIKDIVTPYFTIPSGATEITLQTALYDGTSFGDPITAPAFVSATVSGNTVSVTGFDFGEKYVTENPRTVGGQQYWGEKLIISFTVTPDDSFLGGSGVATNGSQSGVYADSDATEPIETFNNSDLKVNIPVKPITPKVESYNIYLSNTLDLRALLNKKQDSRINGTDNAYVEIIYTIKDYDTNREVGTFTIPAGRTLDNGKWKLVDDVISWETGSDGEYTVSCRVKASETNYADTPNAYVPTATVTVFKPEITFNDTTIYLGTAADYSKNHSTDPVVWKHGTESSTDDIMTGDRPSVTVEYNPIADYFTECKDVSVSTVKLNGNGNYVTNTTFWNNGTKTDSAPQFTVHVVKPVITSEDITIYLSNTVDLEGQMTEAGNWVCGHTGSEQKSLPANNGETRLAPTIDYTFMVGSTPVSTAIAYQPLGCTEIKATATVNGKNAPISTDTAGKDYSTFQIHVLKPTFTVTCTDLWADYGRKVTLDQGMNIGNNIIWGHSCENTSYGTPTDWSISCNYAYTPNDKITDNQYTMGEADKNFNVEVVSFTIEDEKNNETTYPQSDKTLSDFATITYKKGEVVTNEFTVHVNKFDLTINKTWNGAACYAQDAIFLIKHVVDDEETEITKAMIAAPVKETRSGQFVWNGSGDDRNSNTITITGLLCGQEYKIEEETDWTWRWNSSPTENTILKAETKHDKVLTDDPHTLTEPVPHQVPSVSFVNNLIGGLGELWFSFCTFVQNIFGSASIQKGGN